MRVIEHKGKLILELDSGVETLTDTVTGIAKHFVYLPPLETVPSPVLEDIFHAINAELSLRDRKQVEETL